MPPAKVRDMLESLAREINTEHNACLLSAADAVTHAINAGKCLLEVKASLKHGEFMPWVEKNCPFSQDAANKYMRLSKFRMHSEFASDPQSLTQALRMLTNESAHEEEQFLLFGSEPDDKESKPADEKPVSNEQPAGWHSRTVDDKMSSFEKPVAEPRPWSDSESKRKKLVEAGQIVTANIKTDHQLIAWAQEKGFYVRIDRTTRWGNPFILDEDGDRDEVCEAYRIYLQYKPSLKHHFDDLQGKVLGCWCYPERCHGDVLIEQLEGGANEAERVGCHH